MDTSKLITITIWATLALIAYEVFSSFASAQAQSNSGGLNTTAANNAANSVLGPTFSSLSGFLGSANLSQLGADFSAPVNNSIGAFDQPEAQASALGYNFFYPGL